MDKVNCQTESDGLSSVIKIKREGQCALGNV